MRAPTLVARWRIRHRWPPLVALGVLAGVVGGLATGAVAGERRTSSAARRLVDATLAPDGFVFVRDFGPEAFDEVRRAVEAHPDTVASWPVSQFIGRTTVEKDWYYPFAGPRRGDDIYRPLVERGRLPADGALDEVALTAGTAATTGLGIGSVVRMDLYTPEQLVTIIEDTETQPAGSHLELRVVGILRDASDISSSASDRFMLLSPGFWASRSDGADNQYRGIAVRTRGGPAGMDRLLASLVAGRPTGSLQIRTTADSLAGIEPANRVLSVGTWVLAATVLLVGGFTLAQAVRRHLGSHATQERVLQVVGFTRSDGVAAATLPGVVAGLVAATLTAPVALAVSPVFPLGRARLLEPDPGPHLDVPVVAAGVAITLVATVGAFAVLSWLDLRERPRERRVERPRLLAAMTPVAPPPVLLGLHLVSEPARGRRGLSARTAMAAAALGVAGLVAATTFSQSLDRLVTTPSLYGLDLDLTIEVPESQLARRLDEVAATPGVEAVAEERSADVRLGGVETVGIAWTSRRGSIEPAVLEGRLPSGPDEVAAGPALLRRLGRDIGDRVTLGDGDAARPVTVVGTVLSPQVVAEDHSSRVVLRADTLDEVAGDQPYPMIVVRYAPGADDAAITAELDRRYPFGVMDESYPTPPPPLRNLADVDAVPTVLVWFFGSLSLVALTNGVVVSGRRARHSLGVARGLGFTSGQVRTVALAMALAIAAVAVVVGVPLGLVVGATAWSGVIDRMDLLPVVRWPVAVAVLVVPVAAAVAALASRWPARAANAHHPADILRVE